MLEARFQPLQQWPGKLPRRKAAFGSTWARELDILERELRHLNAKDIVIEAGFRPQDIRNDGWPRSGSAPSHPGIVLYFSGKTGKLRMPSGTYNDWRSNLYAIALTLERLRAIDRYGVTMGQEQYQGFKALPPATTKLATLEDAAQFVSIQSGALIEEQDLVHSKDGYRRAYREAAARLHPESRSGNEHLWHLLMEAKALLDQHHGTKEGAAS